MKTLEEIENEITKSFLLAFIAPFIFAYWTDNLMIDILSLFLISQSKLCSRPTIRGTVMVQLGLYFYSLIYLFAPLQFVEDNKSPLVIIILASVFYIFVAIKAFKTAKLLSPFLVDKTLTIDKKLTNGSNE